MSTTVSVNTKHGKLTSSLLRVFAHMLTVWAADLLLLLFVSGRPNDDCKDHITISDCIIVCLIEVPLLFPPAKMSYAIRSWLIISLFFTIRSSGRATSQIIPFRETFNSLIISLPIFAQHFCRRFDTQQVCDLEGDTRSKNEVICFMARSSKEDKK